MRVGLSFVPVPFISSHTKHKLPLGRFVHLFLLSSCLRSPNRDVEYKCVHIISFYQGYFYYYTERTLKDSSCVSCRIELEPGLIIVVLKHIQVESERKKFGMKCQLCGFMHNFSRKRWEIYKAMMMTWHAHHKNIHLFSSFTFLLFLLFEEILGRRWKVFFP